MAESKDIYSFEAVMRKSIKNALIDLRTVHPCKVRNVRENGTVDVELLIHASFSDGSNQALPPVTQMPVLFQGNSDIAISFPVNVGDEGLALFSERDLQGKCFLKLFLLYALASGEYADQPHRRCQYQLLLCFTS